MKIGFVVVDLPSLLRACVIRPIEAMLFRLQSVKLRGGSTTQAGGGMLRREEWLDAAKGVGIFLVVSAHVLGDTDTPFSSGYAHTIALFHMPLFFVISGYLFSPAERYGYVQKKIRGLAIPYAAFLICLMVAVALLKVLRGDAPDLWQVKVMIIDAILGGRFLTREFGVFWFVTCLFFSQIIYNEVANRIRGAADPRMILFAFLSVTTAYFIQALWPDIYSPWAISNVPLAIGALWFGHLLRERGLETAASLIFVSSALALATVAREAGATIVFAMKYTVLGPPYLGLVLALALSLLLLLIVRKAAKFRWIAVPLAVLGQASLVIMFLHQFVHFSLRDFGFTNDFLLVVLSVALPLGAHVLIKRSALLSPWFLGRGDLPWLERSQVVSERPRQARKLRRS